MDIKKMFNDIFSPWSRDAKPDYKVLIPQRFRPGKYIIDGDSNAAPIFADWISPEATSWAWPGTLPQDCTKNFNERIKDFIPIKGVFLQTGGNIETFYPMKLYPMDFGVGDYVKQMTELINAYKTVIAPEKILVGSLPWVDPDLKFRDMDSYKTLPPAIQKAVAGTKLNYIFALFNHELSMICGSTGATMLDITTTGRAAWDKYGKRAYWDRVHYDNTHVRVPIVMNIKKRFGV